MSKKIKFTVNNIKELNEKIEKARALSMKLARTLKEINELKFKIQSDDQHSH